MVDDSDKDLDDHGLAAERDANTIDIFSNQPIGTPKPKSYTVLARKYRPRTFEDLIGQDVMVRTLTHAFAAGRIAHAFMLTGVRGVGKTTTARLLARALNFENDTIKSPSVDLSQTGYHCQAIIEGRHMDVLELDAASRTGVDAMRDLLDSVHYAPTEARFKVYVIDEVHMLSIGAFNALLKTLEEPPPHVKFIFATTEIRKVPVTILSRCQRYDLRRVEIAPLSAHLEKVCALEGMSVAPEGLAMIARAGEGSVRDCLSLLDQALLQGEIDQIIDAETVRDMLGLADRGLIIDLFANCVGGKLDQALGLYRELYQLGADPQLIMNDLIEAIHAASLARILGPSVNQLPEDQALRLTALGSQLGASSLSRLFSLSLKLLDEVKRTPDPHMGMEMAIIRLCHAADLPGPEELLKSLWEPSPTTPLTINPSQASDAPQAMTQSLSQGSNRKIAVQPIMDTGLDRMIDLDQLSKSNLEPSLVSKVEIGFEWLVGLLVEHKEIGLLSLVEHFFRPISFKQGAISFATAAGAPDDLGRKLSLFLKECTDQNWFFVLEKTVVLRHSPKDVRQMTRYPVKN